MALGALHPHPEKQLSHIFDLLLGILDSFVPGDGGIADDGPRRCQQFPHKLIVGFVCEQAVTDPGVKCEIRDNVAGIIPTVF